MFVAKTEDFLYRRRPAESNKSKGKGRAEEEEDEREEGEVNDGGEDREMVNGSVEGNVPSVQRKRKQRFERWLDERAGSRRIGSVNVSGSSLAASLPPLPLPPPPHPAPLPPSQTIEQPVEAAEREEGEVEADVEMGSF